MYCFTVKLDVNINTLVEKKFVYSRLSNKHSAAIINLSIFSRGKKEFDIPNRQGELC